MAVLLLLMSESYLILFLSLMVCVPYLSEGLFYEFWSSFMFLEFSSYEFISLVFSYFEWMSDCLIMIEYWSGMIFI